VARSALVPAALAVLAALGAALLGWGLLRSQSLPSGPEPVAFDRAPCTRCGMLIGEPAFAGQLQTRDGRVLDFDDPGCLLLYLRERDPDVHAVWLHHHAEDRWIPQDRVAFVPVPATPMGYGLGAVERGGATLSWDEALARAAASEDRRRHP